MNDISKKSNELVGSITKSDLYKRYIELKKQMLDNVEIMSLIDKVKNLQKEIIRKKAKGLETKEIDEEINQTISELNEIPLYAEYDRIQEELNNTLQVIKKTIESCINDITK